MTLKPLDQNEKIPLLANYVPSRVIVRRGDANITQANFLADVTQVATKIHSASYIVNLCEDRYQFLVLFCATLVSGATNLLPPNKLPATISELQTSYSNTQVHDDNSLRLLLETPSSSVVAIESPEINAMHIAAIAFTSGSTGQSKPYVKHWGTLAATARLLGDGLHYDHEPACILATVPSQHMYGLETTIMMPLQANFLLDSSRPFFPKDIQGRIETNPNPVVLVSSPLHLRALINAELSLPKLRGIICATAPLDIELAQHCELAFGASLHEIYGCTEVGSMALRRTTATSEWSLLTGFELSNAGDGIHASAPHLNGSFVLQDNLSLTSPAHFLLAGRHTDTINVAGKRTSLAYLNTQILRIKGVQDAVVFLPENQQGEVRPAALIVSELDEKTILTEMATQVDAVFLPRPLRKVTALPRNETGKITQASLQQLWLELQG
ncbi:AMP-binding protein [Cellvibrio sp.]|uniref:AMP-binding protein n=1 Tax=Cellvibrio sp. TaxID=1965322 RepID=UPI0039648026